ncbi:hypothetical protein CALCODRAFT_500519 [Calocera cornea HHB12733]|uniref:Uncharacterized protein n=1 Tax=Calocera cornea HHB12733 TaxID=1353952 RepID=A0A165E0V7_9BASI|nr:hypothetical protein CALCODRAFT_500519 [Calocera cornea HHB12733]
MGTDSRSKTERFTLFGTDELLENVADPSKNRDKLVKSRVRCTHAVHNQEQQQPLYLATRFPLFCPSSVRNRALGIVTEQSYRGRVSTGLDRDVEGAHLPTHRLTSCDGRHYHPTLYTKISPKPLSVLCRAKSSTPFINQDMIAILLELLLVVFNSKR